MTVYTKINILVEIQWERTSILFYYRC